MEFQLLYSHKPNRRLAIRPRGSSDKKANFVLVLETIERSSKSSSSNNVNCTARFQPASSFQLTDYSPLTNATIYGCLGLVLVDNEPFVCLVTDGQSVGDIEGSAIYRINNVMFFSLVSDKYDELVENGASYLQQRDPGLQPISLDNANDQMETLRHPCQPLQKFLQSGSFYFSYDFDLTRQASVRLKGTEYSSIWESSDERFFWNRHIIKELLKFRKQLPEYDQKVLDSEGILVMAISGFVRIDDVQYNGDNLKVVLISRLSCKRAGTRFNARGVDDDGCAANNVETETLLYTKDFCYSHVLLRGSVPLFWEQQGLQLGQHKIQITRSFEATHPAVERHFNDLIDKYGKQHVVNLLSTKEGSAELQLSEAFRTHVIKLNQPDLISMTNFDFHAHVKGNQYENLSMLTSMLRDATKSFGYFLFNRKTKEVLLTQSGTFRVNCLDCLDRTNVVEGLLCKDTLNSFLVNFMRSSADILFNMCLNEQWADNGDELSRIYTGTGALKSGFTRSGKRTLAGLMDDAKKSATRFYQNNFQDKYKQEVIDLLLGKLGDRSEIRLFNPIREAVMQSLQSRFSEFAKIVSLKTHVATWNVNGKQPQGESLLPWLTFDSNSSLADIYIVGFQEIVELSPQQMMATDNSKRLGWEELLLKTLNSVSGSNFVLLRSGQLVGAALIILVRAPLAANIRNVDIATKKTGFAGLAGNKGGVAIRMEIFDTSVCFLCAHLAAGHSNVEDRNQDYRTISEGLVFKKGKTIRDHEMVFFFGDFNYRIDMAYEDVLNCIGKGEIDYLLKYDQLLNQMRKEYTFPQYSEGAIKFLPTYKYDNGTNQYDTSEKQRIPAWTDRILFTGSGITVQKYERAELLSSDHKPVKGLFQLDVRVVNKEVKERIQQELYRKYTEVGSSLTVPPANTMGSSKSLNSLTPSVPIAPLIDLGENTSAFTAPATVQPTKVNASFNWWEDNSGDVNALTTQAKQLDLNSTAKASPPVPKKPAYLVNNSNVQSFSSPVQTFGFPPQSQSFGQYGASQPPALPPRPQPNAFSYQDTSLFGNSSHSTGNGWAVPTTSVNPSNFAHSPLLVQQRVDVGNMKVDPFRMQPPAKNAMKQTVDPFGDPFGDPWASSK